MMVARQYGSRVTNNYKIVCLLQCLVILSLNFPYPFTKKLITYKIKKVKEVADSHSTISTFQTCSELKDEFTGLEIQLWNELVTTTVILQYYNINHLFCFRYKANKLLCSYKFAEIHWSKITWNKRHHQMTILQSKVMSQLVNTFNWFQSCCHVPVEYKACFNVS